MGIVSYQYSYNFICNFGVVILINESSPKKRTDFEGMKALDLYKCKDGKDLLDFDTPMDLSDKMYSSREIKERYNNRIEELEFYINNPDKAPKYVEGYPKKYDTDRFIKWGAMIKENVRWRDSIK